MAWNHPVAQTEVEKKSPRRFRGIIIIVCLCCVGVAGWFLCQSGPAKGDPALKDGKKASKEVRPAAKRTNNVTNRIEIALQKVVEIKEHKREQTPSPNVVRLIAKPDTNIVERIFTTGTEQLLSLVFTREVGDVPMPIPPIGEEDRKNLVSILISKNKVNESDDESTRLCKETVDFAKKEMADFIADGGDPDEFLQHYFNELNKAYEMRQEALQQAVQLYQEDPTLCKDFLVLVNKKFENDGIKTIQEDSIDRIYHPDPDQED